MWRPIIHLTSIITNKSIIKNFFSFVQKVNRWKDWWIHFCFLYWMSQLMPLGPFLHLSQQRMGGWGGWGVVRGKRERETQLERNLKVVTSSSIIAQVSSSPSEQLKPKRFAVSESSANTKLSASIVIHFVHHLSYALRLH